MNDQTPQIATKELLRHAHLDRLWLRTLQLDELTTAALRRGDVAGDVRYARMGAETGGRYFREASGGQDALK